MPWTYRKIQVGGPYGIPGGLCTPPTSLKPSIVYTAEGGCCNAEGGAIALMRDASMLGWRGGGLKAVLQLPIAFLPQSIGEV